jgi:hypothetical protein
MAGGFVEVVVRRRHRGRPSRRRLITVRLRGGTQVQIGDRVSGDLAAAILATVSSLTGRRC